MFDRNSFLRQIQNIKNEVEFERLALELFTHQVAFNPVYKEFVSYLSLNPNDVKRIYEIPFLPIDFFKTQEVKTDIFNSKVVFESSGTTGQFTSKHHVRDVGIYLDNAMQIFESFYGDPEQYAILALLPSYLERQNSSLVFMVNELIKASNNDDSGFFLHDLNVLIETIHKTQKPVILFGVTFALLDLVEQYPGSLADTIIIETGGMKGRRKEITRDELHKELQKLHPKAIHSEYGMTELLSQAYAQGGNYFSTPAQMSFLVRDPYDPLAVKEKGSGALNIIDLANVDSCAFIATQDLVRIEADGKAEILGRMDNADIRGCNLLVLD